MSFSEYLHAESTFRGKIIKSKWKLLKKEVRIQESAMNCDFRSFINKKLPRKRHAKVEDPGSVGTRDCELRQQFQRRKGK
jgi:hypothetical protein